MEAMPELPPQELTATLERLGLATREQVARMGRRVGRLAKDLPRFDSVWIDALAQTRVLTPFQAAELNAGRGGALRVGPFLLCERLAHPCYAASYRAKNVDSGAMVRLAIIDNAGPHANAIFAQLQSLHNADVASDGERIFAAWPWVDGRTAAEWIVHHGRFPPEVVLEIARAMLAALVALERAGVRHGDVSASSLILTDAGDVALAMPGLRAILRPEEGYAHADLRPEAFDSLAPERVASGTPSNAASDIYACGCVWWHLLCGRPPLAGGDSLTKLRAAQTGGICDVRRYAHDVPPSLAAAIAACVEVEPSRRPESMARLAAMLGSPTANGKGALADCLARTGRPTVHWTTTARSIRRSNRTPLWLAGAVCCLTVVVALLWPAWQGLGRSPHSTQCATASGESEDASRSSEAASGSRRLPRSIDRSPSHAIENDVVPASFQQPLQPPVDLVLAADRPLAGERLELRAGQRVRAAPGHRATLLVPTAGLVVDKDDVRFENIDFVWEHAATESAGRDAPAIVRLMVGRAEFRGCSFRCVTEGDGRGRMGGFDYTAPVSRPPASVSLAAIRWIHPAQLDPSETSLPTGRIRLSDCVFERTGTGLDCRTVGALNIEFTNTLHLGAGPLVRLDHCPRPDEPLALNLSQVTVRDTGPLLECLAPRVDEQPVEIAVQATACVFAPKAGEPLVRCGGKSPERLLCGLRWTGQGSLVTPKTPILDWRGTDGSRTVDESALSIAGLVRSEVEFAGKPSSDPAASRVVRWQAPLQSASPPGIDPAPLPSTAR
jgi:eukaryotic-like serine/threonine-protein kinase